MKKALSSVLAILLTLGLLFVFTACTDPVEPPVEPDTTTEEEITTVPEHPITTNPNGDETPPPDNGGNEDGGNGLADPFAPPANLDTLNNAEKLAYFNLVANRVRTEKPGFKEEFSKIISDLTFTGVVRLAQSLIDDLISNLTGADDPKVHAPGTDNQGKFLSDITPFELRPGDVSSISAQKSGENWVMTVKIISETNPAKPSGSANARAYTIASRQEVLDEITGFSNAISANVNDATLRYNSGIINLTINPDGQVIAGDFKYFVDATANNVKLINIISTNVTARMTTTNKFSNFKW